MNVVVGYGRFVHNSIAMLLHDVNIVCIYAKLFVNENK